MKNFFFYTCFLPCIVFGLESCKKDSNISATASDSTSLKKPVTDLTKLNYSVQEAKDWNQLFIRDSGWIGGDGIFSIPLNGVDSTGSGMTGNTLLLFSDTQIGSIKNHNLAINNGIINNSIAEIKGNIPDPMNIVFKWHSDQSGIPSAIFTPKTALSVNGEFYWLGDGFVNQERANELDILAYKMTRINSGFGFAMNGSSLITSTSSAITSDVVSQTDAPLFVEGTTIDNGYAFGSGIYVNTKSAGALSPDGYVYIYGVKNLPQLLNKGLMVGRVKPVDFKDFSKWRFFDGAGWSIDIHTIKSAFVVTDRVSDELSISALPDGRYLLVFQADVWGPVSMRIGQTPFGPFGPVISLWDCKEALTGKNYYAYNAKAHPALSNPGELLISFNVNSFSYFQDIQNDPNLYRPHFIKMVYK